MQVKKEQLNDTKIILKSQKILTMWKYFKQNIPKS